MHASECPKRPEASDPLELLSRVTVSHLLWVLGTKPDPIQVMYGEFLTAEVSCQSPFKLVNSLN